MVAGEGDTGRNVTTGTAFHHAERREGRAEREDPQSVRSCLFDQRCTEMRVGSLRHASVQAAILNAAECGPAGQATIGPVRVAAAAPSWTVPILGGRLVTRIVQECSVARQQRLEPRNALFPERPEHRKKIGDS